MAAPASFKTVMGSSTTAVGTCEVSEVSASATGRFAVVGVKTTASSGGDVCFRVELSSLARSSCSNGVFAVVAYDSHWPGRCGRNSLTGLLGLLGLALVGDAARELSRLFSHDCTLFLDFFEMLDCVEPRLEWETSPNLPASACTRPLLGDSDRSRSMMSWVGDCVSAMSASWVACVGEGPLKLPSMASGDSNSDPSVAI